MPADNPLSPWHPGEIALQEQVGAAAKLAVVGRHVLRDHLIDQHRDFFLQLPFVVLGTVDTQHDVWATIRVGRRGFLRSPDPQTLSVALARDGIDPAEAGITTGAPIALLGIELHTRRRNRLNGTVSGSSPTGFDIKVEHSFGNCAQYIQQRRFRFVGSSSAPSTVPVEWLGRLDPQAGAMIRQADTFFVASYADRPEGMRQVDVSHRGGKPGFVHIGRDGALTVPDFAGNRFFNTLGNILVSGKAGLSFVDFDTGDLLQMSGDAALITDAEEAPSFQGAERMWRFIPRRIARRRAALTLRWDFYQNGWSPNVLQTGSWAETLA